MARPLPFKPGLEISSGDMDPRDIGLLSAMMATVGSIWAIGFVAYVFIYQNFSDTDSLPAQVEKIKVHIDQGERGYWEDQRQATLRTAWPI